MSEITRSVRRKRADGERSAGAVLDAAIQVLGRHPDASIEEIATAAGVSRQTVYAHFSTRDALLQAAVTRITAEVVREIEAAHLDQGPPREALLRFLDTCWQVFERYPILLHLPPAEPADDREAHAPVIGPLQQLIQRGQASGDFDPAPSADWLLAATMALGHTAGGEVSTGRMTTDTAISAFRHSVLKLFHP